MIPSPLQAAVGESSAGSAEEALTAGAGKDAALQAALLAVEQATAKAKIMAEPRAAEEPETHRKVGTEAQEGSMQPKKGRRGAETPPPRRSGRGWAPRIILLTSEGPS